MYWKPHFFWEPVTMTWFNSILVFRIVSCQYIRIIYCRDFSPVRCPNLWIGLHSSACTSLARASFSNWRDIIHAGKSGRQLQSAVNTSNVQRSHLRSGDCSIWEWEGCSAPHSLVLVPERVQIAALDPWGLERIRLSTSGRTLATHSHVPLWGVKQASRALHLAQQSHSCVGCICILRMPRCPYLHTWVRIKSDSKREWHVQNH
jgi:hypothetical protein